MRKFKRTMIRKIHLGRFGVPVWTVALTMLIVLAAAGQSVGPALAGQITGDISLTVGGAGVSVGQAIVLDTKNETNGQLDLLHTIVDAIDGVIAVNDKGTGFTAAIEAVNGKTVKIQLDLVNNSGEEAFALIILSSEGVGVELNAEDVTPADTEDPDPLPIGYVDPADVDGVTVAQLSENSWLMKVPATESGGDLDFQIEISGGPGIHSVSALIVHVEPGG